MRDLDEIQKRKKQLELCEQNYSEKLEAVSAFLRDASAQLKNIRLSLLALREKDGAGGAASLQPKELTDDPQVEPPHEMPDDTDDPFIIRIKARGIDTQNMDVQP